MGAAVTRELGAGLYATLALPEFAKEFDEVAYLFWCTVLDDGEDPTSERVRLAGGPGTALAWHGAYEFGGRDAVAELPGGEAWNEVVDETSEDERHLAVHVGHCVELNDADTAAWHGGGHSLLTERTVSGSPAQVRGRLDELADGGVTELVYQPCGPDIRRELEEFLEVVKSWAGAAGTSLPAT